MNTEAAVERKTEERARRAIGYCCAMDNELLQYIVAHQCWDLPHGKVLEYWDNAAFFLNDTFQKKFKNWMHGNILKGKGIRKRFKELVDHFRGDETDSLYKSGTQEDFDLKKQLLTKIVNNLDASIERRRAVSEEQSEQQLRLEEQGKMLTEVACAPANLESAKKRRKVSSGPKLEDIITLYARIDSQVREEEEQEHKRDELLHQLLEHSKIQTLVLQELLFKIQNQK